MPRNATILKLFDIAFWILLPGALVAGSAFGLVANDAGSRLAGPLIIAALALGGLSAVVRITDGIAERRMLARAFAVWQADPALGPTVSGEILAELAGFDPDQAWRARQWLLARGKREGVRPEAGPDTGAPLSVEANRWEFRFPRNSR